MNSVFILWHTHQDDALEGGEDVKLLGVYSTETLAELAKERMSEKEGFKDFLEGFEIANYKLDKDQWSKGFITVPDL